MYNNKLINGCLNIPITYNKIYNSTLTEIKYSLDLINVIPRNTPYIYNNEYLKKFDK